MNESNDPELEHLLRCFRPGDPPAQLRERILLLPMSQPVWPWAAAAAVLLASALTLRIATQREAGRIDLGTDHSAEIVDNLTEALGGDAAAREAAESIVREAQLRADDSTRPPELEGEQP